MSKRRVMSDRPARRAIEDQAAVPDLEELVTCHQDGPQGLRRLDQDLVFAGLGEHQEPAIAQGSDGGQGRRGEPPPGGPPRTRLESEVLGASEHFRCAHSDRSEAMPDLSMIGGNALETQQRHEGFEPRIGWPGAVSVGAHACSPGLVAFRRAAAPATAAGSRPDRQSAFRPGLRPSRRRSTPWLGPAGRDRGDRAAQAWRR